MTARYMTCKPVKPRDQIYRPPVASLAVEASPREMLLALVGSPNIASRRPLFEQYDAIVQSRTVRRPEQADAAVLALDHDPHEGGPIPGLAVSIDCNGRRVAADPYRGTIEAALECAANLACVGAQPLGTTNNLNFGNPEKGHIAWQLTESVRGLGDACRALGAPIVGGNVSLYNEGATQRPDLPDAGYRHGRPPARCRACGPPGICAGGRCGGAGGPLCPIAACERAGEAAGRAAAGRFTGVRDRRGPRGTGGRARRGARRAHARAPTTSPRAVLRWPWPSAAWLGELGCRPSGAAARADAYEHPVRRGSGRLRGQWSGAGAAQLWASKTHARS